MNRRTFAKTLGASVLASATHRMQATGKSRDPLSQAAGLSSHAAHQSVPGGPPQQIAMLLYPGMYALDLVGPHAFLSGLMNVDVQLVAKTLDPVLAAGDLKLVPTSTLKECPHTLDVLFVPGGQPGTNAVMQDAEILSFLADRGSRAHYVTSVCTGSLILGAAGLLQGYKATSHWSTRDLLPLLGATPVNQRVVEDRNRITGAGVTSGIDFGLVLAARMRSPEYAEMLQLINEYDPQPPFRAGTPAQAGPEMTEHLTTMLGPTHEGARTAAKAAAKRLGIA
jgi:cyclohexyl-isocyanide hydratase